MFFIENKFKFAIGDRVGIVGAGRLSGLVVDYYADSLYVVAFPNKNGKCNEFVFFEKVIYKK